MDAEIGVRQEMMVAGPSGRSTGDKMMQCNSGHTLKQSQLVLTD